MIIITMPVYLCYLMGDRSGRGHIAVTFHVELQVELEKAWLELAVARLERSSKWVSCFMDGISFKFVVLITNNFLNDHGQTR